MRLFAKLVCVYFILGWIFVTVFGNGFEAIKLLSSRVIPFAMLKTDFLLFLFVGFGALFFFIPRKVLLKRVPEFFIAIFFGTVFYLTFNMVKKTLPNAIEFYADPFLIWLDRSLHFGTDPIYIAHSMFPNLTFETTDMIYNTIWSFPAMFFPVILALFDGDALRVKRFVILHMVAWAVLGGLVAVLVMSGGPIFYDNMYNDPYFSGIPELFAGRDYDGSITQFLQERLWRFHLGGDISLGTGISAFPSVHVAMATVYGLYIFDRWKFLLPVSIAIVAVYQFLSVYLAWHYAVDGYFSILVLVGLWWWLRQREPAENVET